MREQVEIIRWEEPLPARPSGRAPGKSSSRWTAVAEELRARPGRSAVLAEGAGRSAADLAWRISAGLIRPFRPAGAFRATTRQSDGVITVYARYVGGGDGAS